MLYIFDDYTKFKGEVEASAGCVLLNSTNIAPDFSKVNNADYKVTFNTITNQWDYENLKEKQELNLPQTPPPEVDPEEEKMLQEAKELEELYNLAKAINPILKQINKKRPKQDAVESI